MRLEERRELVRYIVGISKSLDNYSGQATTFCDCRPAEYLADDAQAASRPGVRLPGRQQFDPAATFHSWTGLTVRSSEPVNGKRAIDGTGRVQVVKGLFEKNRVTRQNVLHRWNAFACRRYC